MSPSPVDSNSIVYKNTEYGFNFSLPKSWKGYSIVTDKWKGSDVKSGNIIESGTMYSIRHPQWTSANPRQDIPIMVFTITQWELVRQEKLSVSAAPIGPSELGRNVNYVFALPARYNFAYPTGYEEVEQILKTKPLQTTNIKTIEKAWGQPNQTDIITSKGTYSTFSKYYAVFGFNKAGQLFEARSLASHKFVTITLLKVKEVLGTPTSDTKYKDQEIIGYSSGPEFKIEMVFPISTINTPNPTMDHYNIIYPQGY